MGRGERQHYCNWRRVHVLRTGMRVQGRGMLEQGRGRQEHDGQGRGELGRELDAGRVQIGLQQR